jgi:alanyl-tRNA synthetase
MSDTDARIAALTAQLQDSEGQIKKLEEVARAQSAQIDAIRKADARQGGAAAGEAGESKASTGETGETFDAAASARLEDRAWFWKSDIVRSTFVDYFKEKRGHTFFKSSPILPSQEDQTLLFVNSGMVQYKPIFVGRIPKNSPFEGLTRAANSQKCVRAGGKHNDLEDVGRDNYHHTYFEMLGNWSFGDYFKAEAIDWAWDLLTNVFGLPGDRLYATYFEGYTDSETGVSVPEDTEAKNMWMKYLPASHVLPGNMKDNFWEMGDTGPCGPCSELHFDRIGGRNAASLVNMDDPNVLEIWNLVFMQFFRHEDRSLSKLPNCHVDTGMGFERLVSVLQCKTSNYDTDVFAPLFEGVHKLRLEEYNSTGQKGAAPQKYGGRMGDDDKDGVDTAYRVIVDHIRTLTFSVTDRIAIGNVGRGYVLKRILRRGVRYGKQFLNLPDGFFSRLVATVCRVYGAAFPELEAGSNVADVTRDVLAEEEAFLTNWAQGEAKFKAIVATLKGEGKTVIPGDECARLYQSGGFPIDLTRIMAEDVGFTVDEAGFDKAQKLHQERSKGESKSAGGVTIALETAHMAVLKDAGVAGTDDMPKYDVDTGGNTLDCQVLAIFDGEAFLDAAPAGKPVGVVLSRTPFYAEQGGQVSDQGALGDGAFAVQDCRKYGEYVLHQGVVNAGKSLTKGQTVSAVVDMDRRNKILPNHTLTHVLNLGLRAVLDQPTVDQKGSLCDTNKLRFDFNCRKAVSDDQLQKAEAVVRQQIASELDVFTKVVPLASAMEITTLRAVFGETYPDPVRVVSVGKSIEDLLADPTNPEWMQYSVELCGGTHLRNTSTAGAFVIASEEGVAKGTRRVTCLTGAAAAKAVEDAAAFTARIEAAFKMSGAELAVEQKALQTDLRVIVCSAYLKSGFTKKIAELNKLVAKAAEAASQAMCEEKCDQAKASG